MSCIFIGLASGFWEPTSKTPSSRKRTPSSHSGQRRKTMHRSREALRFPFLWHGSGSFDLCHKTTVKVGLPAILSSRGLPCPSIAVFCRKTTDERLGSKGLKPTRRFSLQALRNDPKTIHIEDFPANRSIGGDAMAKFAARRCEHAGGRAWGTRRKGRRRAKAGRTHGGTATEGERVQSRTDELRPSLARAGGMGYNERHGHRTRHPTAGGRGLFRLAFGRARTSRPRTARPRTARFRTAGACAVRELIIGPTRSSSCSTSCAPRCSRPSTWRSRSSSTSSRRTSSRTLPRPSWARSAGSRFCSWRCTRCARAASTSSPAGATSWGRAWRPTCAATCSASTSA